MTHNDFLSTISFNMLKRFFYAIKYCEEETHRLYLPANLKYAPYLDRQEVEHFINILKYLDDENVIEHLYNDIDTVDFCSHCNDVFEETDTYREMMSVLYDEEQASFYTTRDDFEAEFHSGHSSADEDDAEIINMFYNPHWYRGR